ncbi:phage tail tape measure protein [Klebsiella sp. PL-2018]|uniref:phage tail tape measure protein n=1 Tax=Klebsiella sp. PL-2018 TaxID=2851540 RepID=UPI001C22280F|nr:phage tail tape measure protein [Klebsiella sp. PL-2018]QXC99317.1 Phage tail length tape-measure protein 1 [Klebsiella sp. PL-2018]
MAQQISDLIINLDVDSASFATQIAKIKGQLNGMASDATTARRSINESAQAQTETLKATMSGAADAAEAAQRRQEAASAKVTKSYEETAQSVDEVHQRVKLINEQYRSGTGDAARLAQRQDALTQSFFKQIEAIRSLKGESTSLAAVQARVRAARGSGEISQGDYLSLISELTARQKSLQVAEEKTTQQKERFLRSLKSQLTAQKLTTAELLRVKAAELGVSDAADIYIRKMETAGKAAQGLGLKSAGARQEISVLISELARGNFGALKGSGITLASRAGWIDQLLSLRGLGIAGLVGGVTASLYLLAKVWYQGAQEGEEFNKQLILTGNYAGRSRDQLMQLARTMSGNGFNQHDAAGALATVVGSGSFQGDELQKVTRTALLMQKAVGKSVDETVKQFQRLKDDPVNAANELDKAIHFLTAEQKENIRVLSEQGRETEASTIAVNAFAEAMGERMPKVVENLGYLERAWRGVKDAASDAISAMMDVGRDRTLEQRIAELRKKVDAGGVQVGRVYMPASNEDRDRLKALEEEKYQKDLAAAKDRAEKNAQELQKRRDAQNASLNRLNEDENSRHTRELAKIKALEYADAEVRNKAIERENKRHKKALENENKTPKGPKYKAPAGELASEKAQAELLTLQTQLKTLQRYSGPDDRISQQRLALMKAEDKYTVLEEAARRRKLTDQEKSILATKTETLEHLKQAAALGDEVARQERLNKLRDAASKFTDQKNAEITRLQGLATGKTERESQRDSTLDTLRTKYQDDSGTSEQVLAKQRELYAAEDDLRSNWLAGAKAGWAEYRDTATDAYSALKSVSGSLYSGLSSQLTELTTTGKANIKEFGVSMLKMIAQVINQLIVAWTIQSALGWIVGGASPAPSGQSMPVPSYRPPGFDAGGFTGHGGKHEPAGVVHKGEFVFTQEATKRIGVANLYRQMRGYATGGYVGNASSPADTRAFAGGGINVYAPVTFVNGSGEGESNSSEADNKKMEKSLKMVVERSVTEGIKTSLRPGGMIYMAQRRK